MDLVVNIIATIVVVVSFSVVAVVVVRAFAELIEAKKFAEAKEERYDCNGFIDEEKHEEWAEKISREFNTAMYEMSPSSIEERKKTEQRKRISKI